MMYDRSGKRVAGVATVNLVKGFDGRKKFLAEAGLCVAIVVNVLAGCLQPSLGV